MKRREASLTRRVSCSHPVRAHPLDRRVLLPLRRRDPVAHKGPTRPQPFNLSRGNQQKRAATPEPVYRFKAQAVPRAILDHLVGVPPRAEVPLTQPQSPALRVTAKYPKRVRVETLGHVVSPLLPLVHMSGEQCAYMIALIPALIFVKSQVAYGFCLNNRLNGADNLQENIQTFYIIWETCVS